LSFRSVRSDPSPTKLLAQLSKSQQQVNEREQQVAKACEAVAQKDAEILSLTEMIQSVEGDRNRAVESLAHARKLNEAQTKEIELLHTASGELKGVNADISARLKTVSEELELSRMHTGEVEQQRDDALIARNEALKNLRKTVESLEELQTGVHHKEESTVDEPLSSFADSTEEKRKNELLLEQLSCLERKTTHLQDIVANQKTELKSLEQQKTTMTRQLTDFQDLVRKLDYAKLEKHGSVEADEVESGYLTRNDHHLRRALSQTRNLNNELSEELDRVKKNFEELARANSTLSDDNVHLKEDMAILQQRHDQDGESLRLTVANVRALNKALQTGKKQLSEDYDVLHRSNKEACREIKLLKSNLQGAQTESASLELKGAELEKEILSLSAKVEIYAKNIDDLKADNEAGETALIRAQQNEEKLTSALQQLNDEKKELAHHLTEATATIQILQQQQTDQDERNTELVQDVDAKTRAYEEADTKLKQLQRQVRSQGDANSAMKAEIKGVQDRLKRQNENVVKLQLANDEISEELQTCKKSCEASNGSLRDMQANEEVLRRELASARDQVQEQAAQCQKSAEQQQVAEQKLSKLQEKLDQFETMDRKLQEANALLKRNADKNAAEHETHLRTIRELENTLVAVQQKHTEANEDDRQEAASRIVDLESALLDRQAEVGSLKEAAVSQTKQIYELLSQLQSKDTLLQQFAEEMESMKVFQSQNEVKNITDSETPQILEVARLETDLQTVRQQKLELQKFQGALESKLSELTHSNQFLNDEVTQLRDKLQTIADEKQVLARQIEEIDSSVAGRNEQFTTELNAAVAKVSETELQLSVETNRANVLQSEVSTLQREKSALQREFQDVELLRRQLATTKTAVKESERRVEAFKQKADQQKLLADSRQADMKEIERLAVEVEASFVRERKRSLALENNLKHELEKQAQLENKVKSKDSLIQALEKQLAHISVGKTFVASENDVQVVPAAYTSSNSVMPPSGQSPSSPVRFPSSLLPAKLASSDLLLASGVDVGLNLKDASTGAISKAFAKIYSEIKSGHEKIEAGQRSSQRTPHQAVINMELLTQGVGNSDASSRNQEGKAFHTFSP